MTPRQMRIADGQVVFRYRMQEKDTGDVPSETIMCIFVELERFVKNYDDCVSMQDKWFVFERLFDQLRISNFLPVRAAGFSARG